LKDKRKGCNREVGNKLTESERAEIISVICSLEYVDLTVHQIVAELASKGVYIGSESSIYRILREKKLQKHRSKSREPVKRSKPPEKIATCPNQVYSWDITYLSTKIKGIYYYLYLILDIWSRCIMGWTVKESESKEYAASLIKETVERNNAKGVCIHADNGSPMRNGTIDVLYEKLGIIKSHSRPRVSTDNPFSESMFKTLKYQINYPEEFTSIEEALNWVGKFVDWYNNEHTHSGIKYVTPIQRHTGDDIEILERRKQTYKKAKEAHPERWSKGVRNWEKETVVKLNSVGNI
jgi:putative transposase